MCAIYARFLYDVGEFASVWVWSNRVFLILKLSFTLCSGFPIVINAFQSVSGWWPQRWTQIVASVINFDLTASKARCQAYRSRVHMCIAFALLAVVKLWQIGGIKYKFARRQFIEIFTFVQLWIAHICPLPTRKSFCPYPCVLIFNPFIECWIQSTDAKLHRHMKLNTWIPSHNCGSARKCTWSFVLTKTCTAEHGTHVTQINRYVCLTCSTPKCTQ